MSLLSRMSFHCEEDRPADPADDGLRPRGVLKGADVGVCPRSSRSRSSRMACLSRWSHWWWYILILADDTSCSDWRMASHGPPAESARTPQTSSSSAHGTNARTSATPADGSTSISSVEQPDTSGPLSGGASTAVISRPVGQFGYFVATSSVDPGMGGHYDVFLVQVETKRASERLPHRHTVKME